MGFTPRQIDQMSPYEYSVCVDGWMNAHSAEDKDDLPTLTYEEFREFMDS